MSQWLVHMRRLSWMLQCGGGGPEEGGITPAYTRPLTTGIHVPHIRTEHMDLGDVGFGALVGIFLAVHQMFTDAALMSELGGEGIDVRFGHVRAYTNLGPPLLKFLIPLLTAALVSITFLGGLLEGETTISQHVGYIRVMKATFQPLVNPFQQRGEGIGGHRSRV